MKTTKSHRANSHIKSCAESENRWENACEHGLTISFKV